MPGQERDDASDRLYQLPLSEFTRERNALAKATGGDGGRRIRSLAKPSASAWAINQLYWRDRKAWDALTSTSERLRSAHRAVLAGRKADLRAADAAHRQAVKAGLAAALRIARDAGQTISPPTQSEIARTLEHLSSEDAHAGRLTKALEPEGFEALQGMPISGGRSPAPRSGVTTVAEAEAKDVEKERKAAARALTAARQRERRDRAAVTRLRKQVAAAQRQTEAADRRLDRARKAEERLKARLREAEQRLRRAGEEVQAAEG